jgi:Flp pilus assembly protein TadG
MSRSLAVFNVTRNTQRGQAAVEFALVSLVFFALVYGVLEVGRLVFIHAEIHNAAREGAHFLSLNPGASQTELETRARSTLSLTPRAETAITRGGSSCHFCRVEVTASYTWTPMVRITGMGAIVITRSAVKIVESSP